MLQLVGRYQRKELGQTHIDDSQDVHVIAIDEEENSVFFDYDSCPEWIPVLQTSDETVVLENKIVLNWKLMNYQKLEDIS
jgi:hypothetical protein